MYLNLFNPVPLAPDSFSSVDCHIEHRPYVKQTSKLLTADLGRMRLLELQKVMDPVFMGRQFIHLRINL